MSRTAKQDETGIENCEYYHKTRLIRSLIVLGEMHIINMRIAGISETLSVICNKLVRELVWKIIRVSGKRRPVEIEEEAYLIILDLKWKQYNRR